MALRQLAKHLKNKVKPYVTAHMDKFPMDERPKCKKQNQIRPRTNILGNKYINLRQEKASYTQKIQEDLNA